MTNFRLFSGFSNDDTGCSIFEIKVNSALLPSEYPLRSWESTFS